MLLSEDGDDGRTLGGVTLVNSFASPRSPQLLEALGRGRFEGLHVHPYPSTIFIRSSTSGTPSARRAAATNGNQSRIAARLSPPTCA
jgi:hypothetical protein